uniref:Transcriptional regulator n=1 Tax=Heterorhabditis bacteriophora TaxID=37862 RepID=A0A1I7X3H5_HETBA
MVNDAIEKISKVDEHIGVRVVTSVTHLIINIK